MIQIKHYSGHIRNHASLCDELGIKSGLSRQEREDKIIVEGFKKWGSDLPKHIYGMFATVLYNDESKEYFLLRDQFGTKPLY